MSFLKPYLAIIFLLGTLHASSKSIAIVGQVTDRRSAKPLEYAIVSMRDATRGAITGRDGRFRLSVDAGEVTLLFSMLGYEPQERTLRIDDSLVVLNASLVTADFRTKDVVVTARRNTGVVSSSRIGQTAISHLQASSLADVMQLLPGVLAHDGSLSQSQQLSLRQVTSDRNTALGTAIVMDGAPMGNDANMQVNNTAQGRPSYTSVAQGGVDLRSITTDRIEEVEVIRGIPSAQYGDLTSGLVILKSKSGETPLSVRLKSEPEVKMVSAGKGVALGRNMGVVNVDLDYARSYSDLRMPYKGYNRYSSQLGWAKQLENTSISHSFDAKLGLLYAADVNRKDPNLFQQNEEYSSTEKGIRLNVGGKITSQNRGGWMISYRVAGSYSHQKGIEQRIVSLTGPQPLALSRIDGQYEGIYLPNEYYSTLLIDGKPLSLSSSIAFSNAIMRLGMRHKLSVGLDIRSESNLGRGQVFDVQRPPFPNTLGAGRSRAYHSLPWMKKGAFYTEDAFTLKLGKTVAQVQAGLRISSYYAAGDTHHEGKFDLEPRINLKHIVYTSKENEWCSLLAWRLGVGMAYKTPTLLHLFPDKAYDDITLLNYFSQEPDKRLLWIKTIVNDATNPKLKPAQANKLELGIEWECSLLNGSLTFFCEEQKNGFDFASKIVPASFQRYNSDSYTAPQSAGKPSISSFKWTPDTLFIGYSTPVNGVYTSRRGIEYNFSFRKIEAIRTQVILDGAYFYQQTRSDFPIYKSPSMVVSGKPYRYMGIFPNGQGKVYQQLNTNIRIVTHIPSYRLVVSCLVQNVWFTSLRYQKNSGLPNSYLDLDGKVHSFKAEMEKDPYMSYLVNKYSDFYFMEDRVPLMTEVNLRITKEVWRNSQISFLVNRIAERKPAYTDRSGYRIKSRSMPFFGVEMKVNM